MGKIKMGGSAVMEFEPDYCEFHITVSVKKDTSSEAVTKGRQRVEEVLQLLTEKAGIKIGDIVLQSEKTDFSSYSDEKYYKYSKSFYFKYKADNRITDRVSQLLKNIDDTEYSIDFKLDNEAEKSQIVIMAAVANAKEKAEKLANALNAEIVGFKEIVSDFSGRGRILSSKNDDVFCDIMSVFQSEKPSLASQMGNHKITISKSVDVIWLTD